MQRMGLVDIAPKPHTRLAGKAHKVYRYLLRGLEIDHPNQVWCSDINYFRLDRASVYLTAVIDWHSRSVLSWEVSVTMEVDFCVSALESALRCHGQPEIFNTDQEVKYTGQIFTSTLNREGIRISRDGKGRCPDNIMIERLWRSVKYEEIYTKESTKAYRNGFMLKLYFVLYNHDRPHQSPKGQTIAEVFRGANAARQAA